MEEKRENRKNKKFRVFLNASLSSSGKRIFNERLKRIVIEEGLECLLPQEILPPGRNLDEVEILKTNQRLIESSDIVLSVLDKPGEGVIFELGVAFALGKPIIIFRSNEQDNLGKIIEGIYKLLPQDRKTGNLRELRTILRKCLRTI